MLGRELIEQLGRSPRRVRILARHLSGLARQERREGQFRSEDIGAKGGDGRTEPFEKTPTHKIKRYLYVEQ